jgi:hypothetical protein
VIVPQLPAPLRFLMAFASWDANRIWRSFGLVVSLLFLAGFGVYGFRLLTNPVELARKVRAKRIYAPFYDLADSRSGRLQMQLLGLIFLIASAYGAIIVILSSMGYR